MSHYETLGVKPDATPEEIKSAYRRASSKAHPDKGGNTELMAAVNQANDVLSDAARRQRYDETGNDAPERTMEQRAMDQLVRFFELVLEMDGNLVQLVRQQMKEGESVAIDEVRRLRKKVAKLSKRRDKIKVKSGENLVHMLIDRQVAAANRDIAVYEEALAVGAVSLKLLDAYESEEEQPGMRPQDPLTEMMEKHLMGMAGVGGFGRDRRFYR